MLLWWLTLCMSYNPLASVLSRIILCAAVTKPLDNSTDDAVTATPVTSQVVVDLTTTSAIKIPSLVSGVYDYDSSINFDRYLQELGVSYILRQLAPLASPVVTIQPSDNCDKASPDSCQEWSIRTDTLFLSHTVRFRLDEPGKDTTMDGRDILFVISRPDVNRWVEEQKSRSGGAAYTTTLVRDFQADRMVVTLTVNDVTSTSFFRRRQPTGGDGFNDDEI